MKEVYRYAYHYAGRPVGEGRLEVERRRGGVRASLQAEFLPPLPPGRQRWQTELDAEGFSLRFQERVEGKEVRVFAVERLEEEGVVLVSQGKESLAYPYLAPYHDPLSLFLALPGLALEPGEVVRFPMPGGRASPTWRGRGRRGGSTACAPAFPWSRWRKGAWCAWPSRWAGTSLRRSSWRRKAPEAVSRAGIVGV